MRNTLLALACGATLLAVSLGAAATESCRYSAPRNATLDAAGLKVLAVEIGPDELDIHGDPGAARIVVHGTACASNPERLKDLAIATARHGDAASIVAHDGDHGIHIVFFSESYAYLKLDISVPQALAVKLAMGSGDAKAHALASLDATVGSGDLSVNVLAGAFALKLGSGDVDATTIGSLAVTSVGSGDLVVHGVRGDARVGALGSGDLGLNDVGGKVAIGSVASGDAKLARVGGSLKVDSVGSGSLVAHGVKGDIAIGAVASGDVAITDAGASVRADSLGSGDFGADGVAGDFSVGAVGSGDVRHHGVRGKVSVPGGTD